MSSIAFVGAVLALVVAMFAVDAVYGELPDSLLWTGLAVVLAPLWMGMAVWGPEARHHRWGLAVGLGVLVLAGLMPVDLPTVERVSAAALVGVVFLGSLWTLGRVVPNRGLNIGLVMGAAVLLVAVLLSLDELILSSYVAVEFVVIGSVAGALLATTAILAIQSSNASERPQQFAVAGWTLIGVLVLNGIAALVSRF